MASRFSKFFSTLIPPGSRDYLLGVRNHFFSSVRKRKAMARLRDFTSRGLPFLLEIGSGPSFGKNGWTTMDLCRDCDLRWDLRKPLPFPDGSVAKIYTSHFLEHMDDAWLVHTLTECRRVLAEGGTLSVSVPDVKPYLKAYFEPGSIDFATFFPYIPDGFALNSPIDHLNYIFYMGIEHRHMFDAEGLLDVLKRAGFRDVRLREFDPELDLAERRPYSLYAEATR